MKSVTGEIVSSTPVSLPKAASILSQFVSADTGASQAVNAYLRRATSAFDELVRLHAKSARRARESLRSDAAEPSARTITSVNTVDERVQRSKETGRAELNLEERKRKKKKEGDQIEEEQRKDEGNVDEGEMSNKKQMKKTKNSDLGTSGDGENKKGVEMKGESSHGEASLGDLVGESGKQKKKRKKDKSRELENGYVGVYNENGDPEDARGKTRMKEEEHKSDRLTQKEENRKKRKSGEIEEERRDNSRSEERPRKKKRSID
ncbi:unnamed protein product [Linum tenue]|uniref:Uncharacterized protein n=1 Tax=Linum tenue TaxID=586396 RepID=A0AAV0QUD3_9ROSI|nr:unnamed protein product [Linum tenue]